VLEATGSVRSRRGVLRFRNVAAIERRKVHRIDHQRREAAVARRVGHDLAREREQHARSLDQQERMQVLLRHVLQPEDARVVEFHVKQPVVVGTRGRLELQRDLELGLRERPGHHVDVDVDLRSVGLLLQRLPNQLASSDANAQMWEHLEALAGTLKMEELLNLDDQTILHRLFHDTPPQLPEAQALQFGCTCSRDRNRNALISLGSNELQMLLDEDGEVTLTCDFCRNQERFDAVDLAEMIRESN